MKSTVIASAVAVSMALGSVSAFARDHGDEHRGDQQQAQAGWQHDRNGDRRQEHRDDRQGWNRGQVAYAPGYYAQPRYYAQSGYYTQPAYYDNHDDGGDMIGAVVLGALVGGLVGHLATTR